MDRLEELFFQENSQENSLNRSLPYNSGRSANLAAATESAWGLPQAG